MGFFRRKEPESSENQLTYTIDSPEQAEEITAALHAVQALRAGGELPQLDSAVQAFFTAPTWDGSKRAVQTLGSTLLSDSADHLLVLHEAESRNAGDTDGVGVVKAHRELLARCRREGIDAAFDHARSQDPDVYGWMS